jgi:hypothetical protein
MADFRASLSGAAPTPDFDAPLAALWWAAKGNWAEAHRIVQDENDANLAWVHAYLHRVEGDLGNAGYWYRQAGQPVAKDSLETEWERIAAALLARPINRNPNTGSGGRQRAAKAGVITDDEKPAGAS